MNGYRWFVAAMLTLPLSVAADGNIQNGKRVFESYGCYQCHGRLAQGGVAGPRLGPDPIPLPVLIAYVRHPAAQMPPYTSKVVPDSDLADIHAFLASLPKPRDVKSIRLLNQ